MAVEPTLRTVAEEGRLTKKLLDEHHRLNSRIEELEHELRVIKGSRSWKFSAPLRWGRAALGFLSSLVFWGKHQVTLRPICHAVADGPGRWKVTGPAPSFRVESDWGRLPVGSVTLFRRPDSNAPATILLYLDTGEGFSEYKVLRVRVNQSGKAQFQLPLLLRELRLDLSPTDSVIDLSELTITEELSIVRYILGVVRYVRHHGLVQGSYHIVRTIVEAGWLPTKHLILGHLSPWEYTGAYRRWVKLYDSPTKVELDTASERCRSLTKPLKISVIMPVYNTPERWLRRALDSVLKQTYPHFELCIADDASTRSSVHSVLREYAAQDPRVRIVYRTHNGHISAASNSALEIATGDFVALFDHDDELHPRALEYVAEALTLNSGLDCVFTDEDRITDSNSRQEPYFKSGFDPIHLLTQNVVSHFGVYRRSIVTQIGGFREGLEGSQDWDFTLRFIANSQSSRIGHLPRVLYHWRLVPGTVSFNPDTKVDAFRAGVRAVTDYLQERGISSEQVPAVSGIRVSPKVSRSRTVAIVVHGSGGGGVAESIGGIVHLAGVKLLGVFAAGEGESKTSWIDHVIGSGADYVIFLRRDIHIESGSSPGLQNAITEILSLLELPEVGVVGGTVVSSIGEIRAGPLSFGAHGELQLPFVGLGWGDTGRMGRVINARKSAAVPLVMTGVRAGVVEALRGVPGPLDTPSAALAVAQEAYKRGLLTAWTPYAVCRVAEEFSVFATPELVHSESSALVREDGLGWSNPNLDLSSDDFFMAFPPRVDVSIRVA